MERYLSEVSILYNASSIGILYNASLIGILNNASSIGILYNASSFGILYNASGCSNILKPVKPLRTCRSDVGTIWLLLLSRYMRLEERV